MESTSITLYSIQRQHRQRRLVIKCEYMQCWGWDECRKGTLNDAYEWINGCNTWYTPFTAVAADAFCCASSILFQILFIYSQTRTSIHLVVYAFMIPKSCYFACKLMWWFTTDQTPHSYTHSNELPFGAILSFFSRCSSSYSTLSHFPWKLFCDFVIYGGFFALQYVFAANIVNFMKYSQCKIGVNCEQHRGMIIKCKKSAINFMQALGTLIYGLWNRFNWFCVKCIYASN